MEKNFMIDILLSKIKAFLDGPDDDDIAAKFSVRLEEDICIYFKQMLEENQEAAYEFSKELPEICASYERGFSKEQVRDFKRQVREQYDKIVALYDNLQQDKK